MCLGVKFLKRLKPLRLLTALALGLACSPAVASDAFSSPRRVEVTRGDGTTIDIVVWDRGEGTNAATLVLGGSDCKAGEHRQWTRRVVDGAPTRWVVAVDKEGAGADANICGPTYEQTSVESQRALDVIRAMTRLKRELGLPASGGFQIIATSSGGMAACGAAGATTDVAALALLSTAGGAAFEADMRQVTQDSGGGFAAQMERVRTDPRMGQTWLGQSNPEIWWWSALPLDCTGQLDGWQGAVMIVHGSADTASPVSSARLLAETLAQRPGVTVDYREMEGAGHGLFITAPDKPQGGDGLDIALGWLSARAAH